MTILVTYASSTGNTRKVAEAVFAALDGPKELRAMQDVADLQGYDLIFVGFPAVGAGPPRKARSFLRKAKGKRTALMVTHAMPSTMKEFSPVIPKCQAAAEGSALVGTFDCQGRLVPWVASALRLHPYGNVRRWVRDGGESIGIGHPNASDLERARAFAREVMTRSAGQPGPTPAEKAEG